MISFAGPFNSGSSTGGAGVSTANQNTSIPLTGLIHGFYVKYNGAPPGATTDVYIATAGVSPHMPSIPLLTITNAATNGLFFVRKQAVDPTGTAIAAWYDEFAIDDYLNVKIDQSNDGTSIDVWEIQSLT